MKARYASTKFMISVISTLVLAVTLTTVACAQQVQTRRTVVLPYTDVDILSGQAVTTIPEIAGVVHIGVADELCEPIHSGSLIWELVEDPDEPPEIRIMSRIIQTSLSDVEAPELPEEIAEKGKETGLTYVYGGGYAERRIVSVVPTPLGIYSGSRRVSGFYMNGYGYLFTIRWPIRSSSLLTSFYRGGGGDLVLELRTQNEALERLLIQRNERTSRQRDAVRGQAGEEVEERSEEELRAEEEELQRQREELAAKIEGWRAEFEDRLVAALKEVMASYGHTLHRAATDESITFIFEQSDNEEDNIILSVKRGELGGPTDKERALRAITISRGSAETSPVLKSQINIMAEIIDAAFEGDSGNESQAWFLAGGAYFGGEARTQYIPGYGVIFRKNARVNLFNLVQTEYAPLAPPAPSTDVTAAERVTVRARTRQLTMMVEEANAESEEKMQQHLELLKKMTAEIFATYGTTLTGLEDDDWIGVNYDVGSAAGLLQSGVNNFLVLVQMNRVREAVLHGEDAAQWLLQQLISNEKEE